LVKEEAVANSLYKVASRSNWIAIFIGSLSPPSCGLNALVLLQSAISDIRSF
jgi:hypothetical protein